MPRRRIEKKEKRTRQVDMEALARIKIGASRCNKEVLEFFQFKLRIRCKLTYVKSYTTSDRLNANIDMIMVLPFLGILVILLRLMLLVTFNFYCSVHKSITISLQTITTVNERLEQYWPQISNRGQQHKSARSPRSNLPLLDVCVIKNVLKQNQNNFC